MDVDAETRETLDRAMMGIFFPVSGEIRNDAFVIGHLR